MANPPSNRPSLMVLGGAMAGKRFVIQDAAGDILVGSDPGCGFHLPLPGVNSIHARIFVDAEGISVLDANSPRGIFINDDRVSGEAPLHNGDILWLGAPGDADVVMLLCRVPPQALPPAPTPATPDETETPQIAAPPPEYVEPTVALAPEEQPSAFEMVDEALPDVEAVPPEEPTVEAAPEEQPSAFEMVEDEALLDFEAVRPEEPTVEVAPGEQPPAFEMAEDETVLDFEAVRPEEPAAEAVPQEPPPTVEMAADEMPSHFEAALHEEPTIHVAPEILAQGPATPPAPARVEERRETPQAQAPEPPPRVAAAPAPQPPPPRAPAPPVPAPKAAAPKAPAPHAPAPGPAPAMPPRKGGAKSNAGLYAGLALLALLVVGGGTFAALRFMKSLPSPSGTVPTTEPQSTVTTQPAAEAPSPEPVTTPAPAEVAVATPTPAPSPEVAAAGSPKPTAASPTPAAKPTPTAKPTPPPSTLPKGPSPEEIRAQQLATQVADLLGEADAALVDHRYDVATGLYDRVLKLDPQNAKASAGLTAAAAGAAAGRRTFVAGRTTVQSAKAAKKSVSGFEDADVSVATAPDYLGRVEFEASPRNVRPGDSFAVKVYLVNEGKKPFKVGSFTVATVTNGARTGGDPAATPPRDIEPKGRVLLQDVPGVWQSGVNTWSLEVVVTSNHGETFKSQLTWR